MRTYAALARFYGWTFDQCRRLRLADFAVAVEYMTECRKAEADALRGTGR